MAKHKPDPKNPLYRLKVRYQLVGFLFIVPSLIGLWYLLPPVQLIEVVICCILLAVGMTAFALAKQAENELKRIQ